MFFAWKNYLRLSLKFQESIKVLNNYNRIASNECANWFSTTSTTNQNNHHDDVPCFIAIKLINKSLLRISGPESFIYLQSLLTNDMRILLNENEIISSNTNLNDVQQKPLIYSFLLSSVGRVLCDMFVYRGRFLADGDYILEVDSNLAKSIKRLLLGYNVNKSVKVEIAQDLNLWSIIPYSVFGNSFFKNAETLKPIDSDDIKLSADPRVGQELLGYRFLTRLEGSTLEQIGRYIKCQSNNDRIKLIEGNILDYIRLRYQLGIAEGYRDINSGFYYPFELNGDFLNAVSINKGLYTSEEKIIKIYSNHQIKRRLLPIEFLCDNRILRAKSPAPGTMIYGPLKLLAKQFGQLNKEPQHQQKIGHLRQRLGRHGIATLLVKMGDKSTKRNANNNPYRKLVHADTGLKLCAHIPKWWPNDFNQNRLIPSGNYPDCLFNLQSTNNKTITMLN